MPEPLSTRLDELGIHGIFLIWSKPQGSRRSEYIAEYLGMAVHHVYFTHRRGAIYATIKYPIQALQTIGLLIRIRPRLVFVQDPPIIASLVLWFCSLFMMLDFVIDTHTQRQLLVDYKFLWGIRRFVGKRALMNIVTNEHLAGILQEWDAPNLVLHNPPLLIDDNITARPMTDGFTVLWSNVGAVDEPREIVQKAAIALPHVTFYVTGNYERTPELRDFKQQAPDNMIFTGYIADRDYYQLLKSVDVVLTLTVWDHTFQNGAWEAMWLGRPVITSDWQLLRDHFPQGVLFVDNTSESLISALEDMQHHHARYSAEILELHSYHRTQWQEQVAQLIDDIQAKLL